MDDFKIIIGLIIATVLIALAFYGAIIYMGARALKWVLG